MPRNLDPLPPRRTIVVRGGLGLPDGMGLAGEIGIPNLTTDDNPVHASSLRLATNGCENAGYLKTSANVPNVF